MDNFSGTRAVSEQHAFDRPALQTWLKARLPGFAGPLEALQFRGGQSNPTFKLVTPGHEYVMRCKQAPMASGCLAE